MAASRVARSAAQWLLGVGLGWVALELPARVGHGAPAPEPPAARSAEPAAGAPGASGLARGTAPTASYEITAALDPVEHLVHATATVRWTNRSRAEQRELYWHLYLNGFEHERTVFAREDGGGGFRGGGLPATFGHVTVERMVWRERGCDLWPGADAHSPGEPDDRTDLRVPLPEPIAPGESATFEVAWQSRLPALVLRTGYVGSFHMVGQWFPKLARLEPDGRWAHFPFHRLAEFYSDFGDYDVTVELPDGFVVAATGKLVARDLSGERARWRFVQSSVHDFAFAAGDELAEQMATTPAGVALRCIYPRGLDWAARRQLDAAAFGLAHYSAAYGDYPYETLTLVHPPDDAFEAGGMEYPTLITTGTNWVYERLGAHTLTQVTLHELAHQWFYGLVATNEHRWPMLDEGLASYAESVALDARFDGASAFSALGLRASLPALVRAWSKPAWTRDVAAKAAPEFESGGDYGGLVYGKPATILHTLGRIYGVAEVERALGRYAREQRFGHPGPEELIAAFEAELGPVVAAALRAGLFEKGAVDFAIESVTADAVVVTRAGPMVLPVEIELRLADGSRELRAWDGVTSRAEIRRGGAAPIVAVKVDPSRRVLIDLDWGNNAARAAGGEPWVRLAPRVLDQLGFAFSLAHAGVGP